MKRLPLVVFAMILGVSQNGRPTNAQEYAETDYGKRVAAFRTLERAIFEKQIEREGLLRVADELDRQKARPRAEAALIVPRYDEFTKTHQTAHELRVAMLTPVATLAAEANITALCQQLEVAQRKMVAEFQGQRKRNNQARQGTRRRGVPAKANRRLQSVIRQQKQTKQAYDAALQRITDQLNLLLGIAATGGPGGVLDTSGIQLHGDITRFLYVDLPRRERGRNWVEQQARYALLDSAQERVALRDEHRDRAEALRLEVDQMIEEATALVSGPAAGDDLQELADLLQQEVVKPDVDLRFELTRPETVVVSYPPYKSVTPLPRRLSFCGRVGDQEFLLKLSPALTLEEIHPPEWALKAADSYPFIHSGGKISLWVGEFHLEVTPNNDAARQAGPGTRDNVLQWIEDSLDLAALGAL